MKHQKIKIGIMGEHPQNDAEALRHLLEQHRCDDIQFKIILKNLNGSDFDDEQNGGASKKFLKLLKMEFDNEKLTKAILVRDADEVISDSILQKKHKRDRWFKQANQAIDEKGILFLAIYEMEALILADIDTFNNVYNLTSKPVGNPMKVEDPKAILKKLSAKAKRGVYKEQDAPEIFKRLNFKAVYKQHRGERSFQTFADELKIQKIIDF